MPLVAIACLAYASGLLAAQTLTAPLVRSLAALALGAGVFGLRSGDARARGYALCALLVVAGAFMGQGARRGFDRCAAMLAAATRLEATLESDAEPGALVRARVRLPGCSGAATLFVAEGSAPAGAAVAVRGRVSRAERGVLVRDATLRELPTGLTLATLRARVGHRIDRLFGPDAPLVRALVIADMTAISGDERDRFARAGLVHMLSVSGLHVAIVAFALELLALALRLPRGPSRVATIVIIGAYVVFIGAPPPAVRAAVMLALVMLSRLAQRPTSRWAVVAVGSTVPLVDPAVVTDLGWQLSVAGTVALVAGATLARRILPRTWRGVRRQLVTAAIISVVATLVTAPLVAWTFGRIALLGPVTNLVADPLMGVLQPLLFLALCVPVAPLESLFVAAAHALIVAFDGIAAVASSIPWAAPPAMPTAFGAIAAGVASGAVVIACTARHPARPLGVALGALGLLVVEPLAPIHRARTELHMIDVGQGDALALRTRAGRWIVVDAGRSWPGGDAGRSTVVPYIAHRGGRVALFIMSHPHADHVGGAASLFDALHPAAFLDPGYPGGSAPYLAALAAARRQGIAWHRVHPGDSLAIDEVVVTALAPDSAWASRLADANLASAVVMIRIGSVRILLTGDAEAPEEAWLLAHGAGALAADVLKVGHHGSVTSTSPAFLAAVAPRVALVSVGAGNRYGHPSAAIIAALRDAGAEVLRTDRLGSVVLRTDGRALEVEARETRWAVTSRPTQ